MNRSYVIPLSRTALAVIVSSGLWACSSGTSTLPAFVAASAKQNSIADERSPASGETAQMLSPNSVRPHVANTPAATPTPTTTAVPNGSTKSTQVLSEMPHAAAAFVNSVGVNVDLPDMSSATAAPAADRIKALGVSHVRIAILRQDPPYNATVSSFLTRSGAMADGITNCSPPLGPYAAAVITASDIRSFNTAIGNRLEAYEAMNEPDQESSSDPNWVADLKTCMQGQINAIPGMPFYGPAISDENDKAQSLGDLSSEIDMGNVHRYLSGNNPGTPGYGSTNACGVYAALSWAMCEARIVSNSKPIAITEMGYNSDSEVDLATQAKYLGRALFVNSNANIVRTYLYCLISYTGADGFGGDGLLNTDLTPKPAYTAIQSILSIMADKSDALNSTASTSALSYTISGVPPSMQHELIEKSDGSYALALWNETSSWNTSTQKETAVAAVPITVTMTTPIFSVLPWSISDTGAAFHPAVTTRLRSFTVPVDDHITIVQFATRPSVL